jgi:tetratricopeptide (TPR) repeat protein
MKRAIASAAVLILLIGRIAPAQDSREAARELEKKAAQASEAEKWDDAAAAYREILKLDPQNGAAWHRLGYSLHMSGKLDEALEAHLKTATFPRQKALGLYNAGCAYALKKDKEKAFDYLTQASAAGFGQLETLVGDTDLTSLHDDPRWEKLVAAVKAAPPSMQAFAQPGERQASRVVWFSSAGAPAAALSYGVVAWKDGYAEQIKSPKLENKRWRLGRDFWTTLDTSVPMSFGAVTLAPGYYYLTLEKKSSGDFVLAFIDAAEVRKQKLDAFMAHRTKGGVEVTLKHEDTKDSAAKLDIALSLDRDDQTKGAITIKFGPHRLSAPITFQLAEK